MRIEKKTGISPQKKGVFREKLYRKSEEGKLLSNSVEQFYTVLHKKALEHKTLTEKYELPVNTKPTAFYNDVKNSSYNLKNFVEFLISTLCLKYYNGKSAYSIQEIKDLISLYRPGLLPNEKLNNLIKELPDLPEEFRELEFPRPEHQEIDSEQKNESQSNGDFSLEKTLKQDRDDKNKVELNIEVKPLLKEIKKWIKQNEFEKAEQVYKQAIEISEIDDYSIAKLKFEYAKVLRFKYYDFEAEDKILLETLAVFKKLELEDEAIATKEQLTQSKSSLGDYDSAEIFANDVLEFANTEIDKARAYIFIGSIQVYRSDYLNAKTSMDKALVCAKNSHLKEVTEKQEALKIMATSNINNSLIMKRLGNLEEAISFNIKAVDGFREVKMKKELGQALFGLAELEIFQGRSSEEEWLKYIEEAKFIFYEIKDNTWLAQSFDFISKVAYTTNKPKLALKLFREGYENIRKTNDKEGIAYFLGKFVQFYISEKDFIKAKESLSELISYAKKNNLKDSIIASQKYSLQIEGDDNSIENNNYLIKTYKEKYNNEQSDQKKAYILVKIALAHEEKGEYILALDTLHKASKKFDELNVVSEYASTLLKINELNIKLGNNSELLSVWRKVINILNGTSYYHLMTIANINCGSYLLEKGNLEDSKTYLKKAEHYISKYNLPNKDDVNLLLKEVNERLDFKKPSVWSFEHMVNRLFLGINNDNFKPLLRYWYFRYQEDMAKHFANKTGLNSVIFSDDIDYIDRFTENFSWFINYSLISSNETFSGGEFDSFQSPYDGMEKGEHLMVPNKVNGSDSKENIKKQLLGPSESSGLPNNIKYVHFGVLEDEKLKIYIAGYSLGLPSIAYVFFQKSNSKSVLESKYFPLHYVRFAVENIIVNDIILCWELKYFPIYINKEQLKSKNLSILSQVNVDLPHKINTHKARKIKKLFNSLFKISKMTSKVDLNDFKFDLDELTEKVNGDVIHLEILITEIPYKTKEIVYPVIIIRT